MKNVTVTALLLCFLCLSAREARAQYYGYVPGTDIQLLSHHSIPSVDPQDAWAVNRLLTDHRIAIVEVNYFTPGPLGGAPNRFTGIVDLSFRNMYSIRHDYNTHASPFGSFLGFIDIITPLFATHRQLHEMIARGYARVPQVSAYNAHVTDSFRNVHLASGYGAHPVSFNPVDNGYKTVPSSFVPLPPAFVSSSKCGYMRAQEVLRRNTALVSCNRRYALVLNLTGNLLLVDNVTGKLLWATNWGGPVSTNYAFIMQPDGEAVLYNWNWSRMVASGTNGHHGATLHVTNDGHLEIRKGSTLIVRYH